MYEKFLLPTDKDNEHTNHYLLILYRYLQVGLSKFVITTLFITFYCLIQITIYIESIMIDFTKYIFSYWKFTFSSHSILSGIISNSLFLIAKLISPIFLSHALFYILLTNYFLHYIPYLFT